MNTKKTDILIVGAGPVGMSLAVLLKSANVDFIIIDKREGTTQLPRAIAINQDSLSLFDKFSIFENLKKHAFVVSATQIFCNKKHIGAINFHNIDTKYPYFFHVSQNIVEQELEKLLIGNAVSIYRGHEFLGLSTHDKILSSQIHSKNGLHQIQSQYVIGVDGGNSVVRKQCGENLDEEFYGSHFMLFDIEVFNVISEVTRYFFAADGYCMVIPKNKKEYRIIFSFEEDPNELLKNISHEEFLKQQLFKKTELSFNIKSIIWYVSAKFGHKINNSIINGNIILAGDALHQFSPIGGTNMNFGLQDAVFLSEIIPIMLSNHDNSLLQKYTNDRQFNIQKQLNLTKKLTRLLTKKNGGSISEYKNLYKMFKTGTISNFLTGNYLGNI